MLQDAGKKQVAAILGVQSARAATQPRPFLRLARQHLAVQARSLQQGPPPMGRITSQTNTFPSTLQRGCSDLNPLLNSEIKSVSVMGPSLSPRSLILTPQHSATPTEVLRKTLLGRLSYILVYCLYGSCSGSCRVQAQVQIHDPWTIPSNSRGEKSLCQIE